MSNMSYIVYDGVPLHIMFDEYVLYIIWQYKIFILVLIQPLAFALLFYFRRDDGRNDSFRCSSGCARF